MKLKLPGDVTGGIMLFAFMFIIAIVQIYVFKNMRAFQACACSNGDCVGQCGGGDDEGAYASGNCACANGICVGDCNDHSRRHGGRGRKGGRKGGKKGKKGGRGGGGRDREEEDEGGGNGGGNGGNGGEEDEAPAAAPKPTPVAAPRPTTPPQTTPPTTPTVAAPKSNCSCMPMDSDPSRQKIETPEGVDCANHEYPGSVAECEALLATVANTPCCTGGGGGGSNEANYAILKARVSRVMIA